MKLWLLRPIDSDSDPWIPWYDRVFGFVVRAETEEDARKLAAGFAASDGEEPWLDSTLSSCILLDNEGTAEVVMKDFASA